MRRRKDLRGIEKPGPPRRQHGADDRPRALGRAGGRARAALVRRLDAAVAFHDELDRRAALLADGPAARATTTAADCYEQWLCGQVVPELATRTRPSYEGVWQ